MILMALDHVRMFFALGTWYADPTNLATTTPLLFFTRWITHFCAPVFVFLAGTSAYLYEIRKASTRETARFLFRRGLWLIFFELVVISFAWTFDATYRLLILQVIWAIGISMLVLSGLVFLPDRWILAIGLILVFGHNLLESVRVDGSSAQDLLWYALHQPDSVLVGGRMINFVYPVLPWIGLMALGYVCGRMYRKDFPVEQRRRWLSTVGIGATLLFVLLRGLNLYGEPREWQFQASPMFTLLSFLNATKYPPSLHFLLMTIGPALILLAAIEPVAGRLPKPVIVFGRVPFFFYVLHLYLIHGLAMLLLVNQGGERSRYILSVRELMSDRSSDFRSGLGFVYGIWVLVVLVLYPLCKWYQRYREANPARWWLSYL